MLHESKKQREFRKSKLKTKLTRMATVWLLAVVAMAAIVIGQDVPEEQQVQTMTPFETIETHCDSCP